ncbi:hypothetical protein MMC26_002308 [Xylographa opegraphella]|nr:hypothetical protein [Xylographa opegraphella]
MPSKNPRARSNTSNSTSVASSRPKSRQSTTSIQSNTTQPALPYYQSADSAYGSNHPSVSFQPIAEAVAVQTLHQFADQNNQYRIESATQLDTADAQDNTYRVDHGYENAAGMQELLQASIAEDRNERQDSEVQTQDAGDQENNAENMVPRKKGAATSAANDIELRRLYRENIGRDLHEVALQVLENDKGPKSEKTKQIFGMLWLSLHCMRSKTGSVPRSRVFSSYANGCGTERVPPLNPASFGKLVRIIFPGIQTRRLGVRGESKYHYVELALNTQDNFNDSAQSQRAQSILFDEYGHHLNQRSRNQSLRPQLPADNTAEFPSPRAHRTGNLQSPTIRTGMASSSLYLRLSPHLEGQTHQSRSNVMHRPLYFQTSIQQGPEGDTQLELPSIAPFLPPGIDEDAVSSLTSVYRSHCLLAIDNFRYCKTEKFCDSYKSLIGLLTVPGQKLLAHPQIVAWISACDWLKYQKMTPLLDQTIMTQLPRKAMLHIQHVASHLCSWITQFFQNQSRQVQDAMLGPANIFVSILERYMRVNRACLDVAGVLDSVPVRDQLWSDWISHVNPYHVIQSSLQHQGHARVLHILTQEVRDLICPSESGIFLGAGTMFESQQSHSLFNKDNPFDPANDVDASTVISRLASFLRQLPVRFPNVDAKTMMMHIDVIGNGIQRNLSLNSAYSLGNWWKIKVFVDEMSSWLAEIGGFQNFGPDSMLASSWPTPTTYAGAGGGFGLVGSRESLEASRPNTAAIRTMGREPNDGYAAIDELDDELSTRNVSHEVHKMDHQLRDAQAHGSLHEGANIEDEELANVHDDSGIGMTMDEFDMDGKYGGFVGGVHGSDPADVVVC